MKAIPYIRFAWALQIVFTAFSEKSLVTNEGASLYIFSALIGFTFVLYCIVMGIQEIRMIQLIEARFFYVFGIFFETLIFLAGFFVINVLLNSEIQNWQLPLFAVWQLLLLVIIFVDVRRIITN